MLNFAYPLWLIMIAKRRNDESSQEIEINGVSLIFLSYNGKKYLKQKIRELQQEMQVFSEYEILILDDNSTDGSEALLNAFRDRPEIKLFIQDEHRGIPYAMNLGIKEARFGHVIFCDQRQHLRPGILKRLVAPLGDRRIGAVSACISHMDMKDCYSVIRKYENYVKVKESSMGNLIGVYGPLYAIKKGCYTPIPEHIILDDLYLSLQIIKTRQIKILGECQIIDEGISDLYDYKRARRYLSGFWQILKDKGIWSKLNFRQLTMLVWHKYLRLIIPILLFLSYLGTGIAGIKHVDYLLAFAVMSMAIIISLVPPLARLVKPANLIRINILYFMALNSLIFSQLLRVSRSMNSMQPKMNFKL